MQEHADQVSDFDLADRRITIAGCPVDALTRAETLAFVERVIAERTPSRHGFVNAGKVVRMQTDSELREALASCDLINADGMAIVWASRLLRRPLPERVNGTNIMMDLIDLAHRKSYRLYLLGARPEVIEMAAGNLRRDYPGIRLVGWHHGYFSLKEEGAISREIRRLKPDIVLVGMNTPKKEFWLRKYVPDLGVPFSMGVGGSFDIVAGLVKRAPIWAQNAGLEWVWRLIQEPRRMWRRYLLGNPQFLWLVAREKTSQLRQGSRPRILSSPEQPVSRRMKMALSQIEETPRDLSTHALNVLGVEVDALNMKRAIDGIDGLMSSGHQGFISCVAAHSIMECWRDPELRRIFNAGHLATPDGMSLVWLLRLKGYQDVERVYGPDLLLAVCQASLLRGYRHFFFGSEPGVPELLAERLRARFPSLQVGGTYSPPFRPLTEQEDLHIVDQINAAQPDIVWVGISTPKQERWMSEHLGVINAPVLIGVGAAFDFLSGNKRQAPRWIQRSGLEWLFRLLSEPSRLWPRYARYPLFALLVLGQLSGFRRYEVD